MLKYVDYDIVFQEIPDEVALAINLSKCPHRCKGCHSQQLQEDIGAELNEQSLLNIIEKYKYSVTCICFMGGDNNTGMVSELASVVKNKFGGNIKTAWYSGNVSLNDSQHISSFDFIKLGPYIEALGGLKSKTTNQRLYKIEEDKLLDITCYMQ